MFKSICKGACVIAAATAFATTSAQAANHTVLIVDGGYFPEITYLNLGDSINFINDTDNSQTVSGPEESWTSGTISSNGSFTLDITEELAPTFQGVTAAGQDVAGSFSFEEAPLTGDTQ